VLLVLLLQFPSSAKRKYSVSSQGDEDILSPTSQRKKQKKELPKPLYANNGKTVIQMVTLTDIVNKTFQIFKASPLYKFHRQTKDLKAYSNKLKHQFQDFAGVPEEVRNVADVNINLVEDDKMSDENNENQPVGVVVGLRDKDKITFLQALLFPREHLEKNNEFIHFPIILIKANVSMTRVFIEWLQESFDCYISPLSIPSYYLSSLITLATLGNSDDRVKVLDKPVELTFFAPTKDKQNKEQPLKSITLSIPTAAVIKLSDVSQGDDSEQYINQSINKIFKSYFQIDLSAMPITRVGTWVAMVGYDGKLKVFSADFVSYVLTRISELVPNKNSI